MAERRSEFEAHAISDDEFSLGVIDGGSRDQAWAHFDRAGLTALRDNLTLVLGEVLVSGFCAACEDGNHERHRREDDDEPGEPARCGGYVEYTCHCPVGLAPLTPSEETASADPRSHWADPLRRR